MSDKKPPAKNRNVWSSAMKIASGRKKKSSRQSLDDNRAQHTRLGEEDVKAAAELDLKDDQNLKVNSPDEIPVSSSGPQQQGGGGGNEEQTRGDRGGLYYDEEAAAMVQETRATDESTNTEPPSFRPRPPRTEQTRPGAFAVSGPDGHPDGDDDYTINPPSTVQDPTVAAEPVNVNEIIEQRVNRALQEARQRATVAEAIVSTTNNNDDNDDENAVVPASSEREPEPSGWLVTLRDNFQRVKRSLRQEDRERTTATETATAANTPTRTTNNNKAVAAPSSDSQAVGFCDPDGHFITFCEKWLGPRARLLGIISGILALAAIIVGIISALQD